MNWTKTTPAWADPQSPGNGQEHRSGRTCVEPACNEPAGTLWSPLWCVRCNIKRMRRLDAAFRRIRWQLQQNRVRVKNTYY